MKDFNTLPEILQKFLTELNEYHKIAAISVVQRPEIDTVEYQIACKGEVFLVYHELWTDTWSYRNRNDKMLKIINKPEKEVL